MSTSETSGFYYVPPTGDKLKRLLHAEAQSRYHASLRRRNFRDKFGDDAFFDLYLPQYKIQGKKHLPGFRFDKEVLEKYTEAQRAKELKQKKRSKKSKKAAEA
ncbi:hypothetical protein C8R43DRAFT_1127533 [Mycena crocata]|nr:hypothetical protein C8R43DRAFT_1127533 [Mycena crocata]